MNEQLLISESPSGNLILGDEMIKEKQLKESEYKKKKLLEKDE